MAISLGKRDRDLVLYAGSRVDRARTLFDAAVKPGRADDPTADARAGSVAAPGVAHKRATRRGALRPTWLGSQAGSVAQHRAGAAAQSREIGDRG